MKWHKLLHRQLTKYLPEDQRNSAEMIQFLNAVNDSYRAFERDKELMNHSFQISEQEFYDVNNKLKEEYQLKQQSVDQLYKSLQELAENQEATSLEENKPELLQVSEYLGNEISRRKQIERKLFETAEFLKVLLDSLHAGIVVIDDFDTILFVNKSFCEMRRIPVEPDDAIGRKSTDFIKDAQLLFKNQDNYKKRVLEIMEAKIPVRGEILETVDGRFIEREYSPVFENNNCIGHLWKSIDVTERILDKKLLQQSEERNRIIMNASFHAIITVDATGKITFWNDQATSLFGWSREEIRGKSVLETIFHDQAPSELRTIFYSEANSDEFVEIQPKEGQVFLKNGKLLPVEFSLISLKQNDEKFYCLFIQDISVRKKNDEQLRFQEEKYRNIIANMNLGLIEVDKNEQINFVNQSFARMSGFEPDELIGLNPAKVFLAGENVELMREKNQLRQQGVADVYQVPVRNKRGELRWWAISGAPNYDDKGTMIGSIGIHLDITDQKQLELELEHEKQKALEASRAKEAFLANMSHEIRTPLNAIIGFLRELERQHLPENLSYYVKNSEVASKHLLSIINTILDLSKIEAGEMSIEHEDFSLNTCLTNVLTVLEPIAAEKGLKLGLHIDEKIFPVLKGDNLRIGQILFNLVGNSLKFTVKGSVEIVCQLIRDYVTYQEIELAVIDTGIGMEKEFTETIFQKFSQEDRSITRKYGGTGLGMAITKELVQLMHGEISIESRKNNGTCFRLRLKLDKGNPEILKEIKQDVVKIDLNGVRVLLVEDQLMNRMVVNYTLDFFHCNVSEATNGKEAINLLKNNQFDIVLMDVQMPEMDGIEATKVIREELKSDIPVIALTANAFKSEIDKCKAAGMNDYVTKPFDEALLVETIARYVKRFNENKVSEKVTASISTNQLFHLDNLHKMSRGNEEFVQKMISIFIEQTSEVLEKAKSAFNEKNYVLLGQLMHKIKPSVESMGVQSIRNEIVELEKAAKEELNEELVESHFFKIQRVLNRVIEALKSELK